MSNPDLTSEMAHFLQDNAVQFLKGATEDELTEFVSTLLPHVSPVGVNRVYPLVAEAFPPHHTPTFDDGVVARFDDDEIKLNMLRHNPEKEGTNGED